MVSFVLVSIGFIDETIAQNIITGTVTDMNNSPLPGVSIVKVGTVVGTETDFDGNFTIEVNKGDTLKFTYVGMKPLTVVIGDETELNIKMEEDVNTLDEVIVVGYGTQKKATLTGSVANVTGKILEKSSSPNLGAALSGKVAGVFIDTGNNAPGADTPGIRIRGTNSFNNTSALVVIDGIPDRAGGLARINPADIESISVLKDASAAIYGARAANGVILVTTKHGKKGPARVTINSNYGIQNFTTTPDMLTGAEYMDLV
ncbi:MAG: TonB-dependent receptor, partial [Flavobacteriia bacterium]